LTNFGIPQAEIDQAFSLVSYALYVFW
jgi:hypothetical protein